MECNDGIVFKSQYFVAISLLALNEVQTSEWLPASKGMKRCGYSTIHSSSKPKKLFDSSSSSNHYQKLLLNLIDSCKSLDQIKQTQAQLITTGLILHSIPATRLIKLLTESNSASSLSYAQHIFDQIPSPDLFIYNTMIKAHSTTPQSSHNSILIYRSMLRNPTPFLPNRYTLVFVFNASCYGGGLGGVLQGEQVHTQAIKLGLESNLFVSNVMVKMYSNYGLIDVARKVFEQSTDSDLYSWNLMVNGYIGFGDMGRARQLFDDMPERDVVSWSTMMAGYIQEGCFTEAMELFREMLQTGPVPNEFILVSVLAACANLVALDQGRWIHVYIDKFGIKTNEQVVASLIDMYAKCGEIEFACKVFSRKGTPKQTIWPWNAMIGGFAMHGFSNEAVDLFEQMILTSIAPNKVTFISLLNACSHGHLVEQGRNYFKSMESSFGIVPEIEHYGCMVDLLGRAGLLKEAEEIILTMPIAPDTIIWGALLGACRIHGDAKMGEKIGKMIQHLDPDHVGCHVLLANTYSASRRWTEAKVERDKIDISGSKKIPGCTSIELNGISHQFLVGDRSHPQTKQIYMCLDEISSRLKNAGFVPETGEVLLDIDDEEDKETALSRHSEKLAIAFGLINTPPGTPIRIVKNLRVCGDCHQATKFISKVYDREIIVRDRIRFHHFRDGQCSCKDYW